ncbi:MAG: hypothetical protein LUG45_02470, partial [Clostridiales bacterium]|nr:hypothetical protein [Clostridiales bacterium]
MYYNDPNQQNNTTGGEAPNPENAQNSYNPENTQSGSNAQQGSYDPSYGSYNGAGAGSRYNPMGSEDETAPLNGQQSGGSYSGYSQQGNQQNGYYGQQGGYNGGAYNGSENATYSSVPNPNRQQSYQAPRYTA